MGFKPIAWLALLRSLVVLLPEFPLAAFFAFLQRWFYLFLLFIYLLTGLILFQMLHIANNKGISSFSVSRTKITSDYAFILLPKRADYSQKYWFSSSSGTICLHINMKVLSFSPCLISLYLHNWLMFFCEEGMNNL